MPKENVLFLVSQNIDLIPERLGPPDPALFQYGSSWEIVSEVENPIVTVTSESIQSTEPATITENDIDDTFVERSIIKVHLFQSLDDALSNVDKLPAYINTVDPDSEMNTPLELEFDSDSDGNENRALLHNINNKRSLITNLIGIHIFGKVIWTKPYLMTRPILFRGRTDDAKIVMLIPLSSSVDTSLSNQLNPFFQIHKALRKDFSRLNLCFENLKFIIDYVEENDNSHVQQNLKSRKSIFHLSHISFYCSNCSFTVTNVFKSYLFKSVDSDISLDACQFYTHSPENIPNSTALRVNFIKFSGSILDIRSCSFNDAQIALAVSNYTTFKCEYSNLSTCDIGVLFKVTKSFISNVTFQLHESKFRNTSHLYSSPDHQLTNCIFKHCKLGIHVLSTQIPISFSFLTMTHCQICIRLDSSMIHAIRNCTFQNNDISIGLYSSMNTMNIVDSDISDIHSPTGSNTISVSKSNSKHVSNSTIQDVNDPGYSFQLVKNNYFSRISSIDFISQSKFTESKYSIEITAYCSVWRCYSNLFVSNNIVGTEQTNIQCKGILLYDTSASGHFDSNSFSGLETAISIANTCGKTPIFDVQSKFEPIITNPISIRESNFTNNITCISVHNSALTPIYIFKNDFISSSTGVLLTICLNTCIVAENKFVDNSNFGVNVFTGNPIIQKNSFDFHTLPIAAIRITEGQSFVYKNKFKFVNPSESTESLALSLKHRDMSVWFKLLLAGDPFVSLWDKISIENLGIPQSALRYTSCAIFVTGNNSACVANNIIEPPNNVASDSIFISILIPRSSIGRLYISSGIREIREKVTGTIDQNMSNSGNDIDNGPDYLSTKTTLTFLFGEGTHTYPPLLNHSYNILPLWLGSHVSSEFSTYVDKGVLNDSAIMSTLHQMGRYMGNISTNPKGILLPNIKIS